PGGGIGREFEDGRLAFRSAAGLGKRGGEDWCDRDGPIVGLDEDLDRNGAAGGDAAGLCGRTGYDALRLDEDRVEFARLSGEPMGEIGLPDVRTGFLRSRN